jgi:hypothetical protein
VTRALAVAALMQARTVRHVVAFEKAGVAVASLHPHLQQVLEHASPSLVLIVCQRCLEKDYLGAWVAAGEIGPRFAAFARKHAGC